MAKYCILVLLVMGATALFGGESPRWGVRAGVGTDINGGLAYGFGANYLMDRGGKGLELGVLVFGGTFEEISDEGFHTYEETTSILVVGLLANYLIGYSPKEAGWFAVAGIGLGSINVEWEEKSETDISLGTLLPGGGSMQSEDGSAGGIVFNLGMGRSFRFPLDVRLEIPVILTFAPPGGAAGVIPTLILTAGYRF